MFSNIFFAPYNPFDISFFHFIGTFGELEEHTKHPEEMHEMNKKKQIVKLNTMR